MTTLILSMDVLPDGTILGKQTIDLDRSPSNQIDHPVNAGQKMDVIDMLAYLRDNPGAHAKMGWDAVSKTPGLPPGTTIWQVVKNHAHAAGAPPALVALGL